MKKQNKNETGVGFVITITLKLMLICAVASALLAFVNYFTAPVIAENEMVKKVAAIKELFPEMEDYETLDTDGLEDINELYTAKSGTGEYLGYCVNVSPNGFGGAVNLMVGIDTLGNVAGINVISNTETAGFGELALKQDYLSSYMGLGGDALVLGTDVDAYAGATITSKAVNKGVNLALSAKSAVESAGYAAAAEPIPEPEPEPEPIIIKENTLNIEEAKYELYGWVTDWSVDESVVIENTDEFADLTEVYLLKEGSLYNGYAIRTKLAVENESADVLIGTVFNKPSNQITGIIFLDYEGEGFKALAADKEYLQKFKNLLSLTEYDGYAHETLGTYALKLCEAVSAALDFYPDYEIMTTQISEETEVSAGE